MECEGGGSRFGDGEATRPEDFKNEAEELSRLLGRPDPQSIDGPPAEESGCAAHSSSASSCSASRTDLGSAEPGRTSAPSSRACDVRPYPGLPPHGLSNEQIDEIMEEVRGLKKRARPCNQELHGWRLIYTLRRNASGINRGDFCVIDPRDQQKIYSVVGLERKLGRADPLPWMASEGQDGDEAEAKRSRDEGGDDPVSFVRPKRRAAAAAAKEIQQATATPASRLTDQLLEVLKMHESKKQASSTSKNSRMEGPLGGSNGTSSLGLDMMSIAEAIGVEQANLPVHQRIPHYQNPLREVRMALGPLLRSGRVRRSLAHGGRPDSGDVEGMLRLLVLNCLQVHEEDGAPWSLPPWTADDATLSARRFVWKGVTRPWLPSIRGKDLIGRNVAIWWEGDGCFNEAMVLAYHDGMEAGDSNHHVLTAKGESWLASNYESEIPQGAHVVRYVDDGLVAVEGLELAAEDPRIWKLVFAQEDNTLDNDEGALSSVAGNIHTEASGCPEAADSQVTDAADGAHTEDDRASKAQGDVKVDGTEDNGDAPPPATESDRHWAAPKVELMMTLQTIRNQLPIKSDGDTFQTPSGWERREEVGEVGEGEGQGLGHNGSRLFWVETSPLEGTDPRRATSRSELEDILEADAAAEGRVWLGQLVKDGWELRSRAVNQALTQIISGLVVLGLVKAVTPEKSGKTATCYIAANQYATGMPFPKIKVTRPNAAQEVQEEEELCDLEKERLANMKRNQELLRQLGLA